jgi:hypothetical protein
MNSFLAALQHLRCSRQGAMGRVPVLPGCRRIDADQNMQTKKNRPSGPVLTPWSVGGDQ